MGYLKPFPCLFSGVLGLLSHHQLEQEKTGSSAKVLASGFKSEFNHSISLEFPLHHVSVYRHVI